MARGMPPAISNWMWALCEKKYGQNANRIAETAAAPLFRERRRTSSQVPMSVEQNANIRAALCAAYGFPVSHHTGLATSPPRMFASEKVSAWRWG